MTQYPNIPYPPLSNPVDPDAPSAPYSPVLYHVDADSRRFVSPLTWRPPLMAQALPTIHLSAITVIHIRPYSGGVPLTIDDEALALIKVADHNRNPLHLSYATPINNEYYEVIIDLIDRSDITAMGQGYIELMINNKVILSDKCVIGSALFPSNEQPPSPYGTIINVTDGSITLSTTPSLYQLSPIPSDQAELNLTFTPSNTDNIHKLLFHSEAPSLVINVDGASISGHYTGPGWYCAMVEESGSTITINLERLTDFTTESVYTVKGFNTVLVEDEWPIYGRLDTLYIHTLTREARIWRNEDWWPVGSSEYKYAPKSETDPLPMGLVAAKGIEEQYAAGDHVHPFSIELTTNHLDTDFTTPTDTHVPSSKLVKDTIDQVKSDLEDEISSLPGDINVSLSTKVDKVEGKGLSTNDLTDALLETLEGSEQKFNKDLNFATPTNGRYPSTLAVSTALNSKVDKVEGKALSTNDLTNELMGVISGAEQQGNKVDSLLNPGAADYPSAIAVNAGLSTKVDKVEGKALSTNDLTDDLVTTINGSEQTSNKATTLSTPDNTKYPTTLAVSTALSTKVDKVAGKVLSDNNYTTEEKNKLAIALTSLPDASSTVKGVIELATSEEVTAGEDSTRAVVPSTLKTELDKKVDKVTGYSLSKNDLTDARLITLNGSEQTSNKATTLANPNNVKYPSTLVVSTALDDKVDKVAGKGLSTNDYTTEEKNKLASALTSLPNATTDAKGIIELATEAEVTTGTLTDRAVVPSTLKVELDKKVDKVTGYSLSKNDLSDARLTTLTGAEQTGNRVDDITEAESTNYPSVLALRSALSSKVDIQEGQSLYPAEDALKVATIQNGTLTTINGITTEIEPWSRSRWTIQGDCSITLSDDWNTTGKEHAYILVTLKTGATLSVPSTVVFDDYLDQGEGVYEVEFINLDGVVHFRWTECYPVNSIKFYVTTTTPNQTYTINALGVSASTDVGWGDGSFNTYTGEASRSHVYATPGTYEVRILPAENIVLLNLQGALVSEVNSEDLKAASNMEYLYLRNLTNATGVIDTTDMTDWPMTRYFYLYSNPLLSIDVDSAHMVGWNPTVLCLHNLTTGNITINTENMAGWTNLENIALETLPTLGGSLDTLHFAGWSNFRSIALYELPAAFSVRFHTEDLIELPMQVLHLFDYDGRNTVINTADLSTKSITYFRLYKLPLSVVTVNSADMLLWNLSCLSVSTIGQATGVIDFADLAGCNIGTFTFISCPLLTFIEDQSAFLSWTSLALLLIGNCTFSTEQMDHALYYLYTAAPSRTVTGGTISFGGTYSSAPSGTYEAPDCPVTSSTPGRGIAYALKNDSCSVGFNKWATVTVK